jgi:hypothetical protein
MELAADEFASLQQMSAVEAFEYLKEAKRKRDEMGVEVHPQGESVGVRSRLSEQETSERNGASKGKESG